MMSRQPRSIQLPLLGTILLCMLVGIYLVACKRSSKPDPSNKIIKHSVDTHSDDALQYWTADKIRHAKPTNLPTTNALNREEKYRQHPPHSSN